MWVLVIMACLACLAGAGVPAQAQDVVLGPEQRRICRELPSNRVLESCEVYYDYKQDLMNEVLATFINAIFLEAGKEELKATVHQDIIALNSELDQLATLLIDAQEVTDNVYAALEAEERDTVIAAEYWANECLIATMLNQDEMTLAEAVKDYYEKVTTLRGLAGGMADAFQEAEQELTSGLLAPEAANLCFSFAPYVAQAATMQYVVSQMYDQLLDTVAASEALRDKYDALFDQNSGIYAQLHPEWELEDDPGLLITAMFDDHQATLDEVVALQREIETNA
ncbi:MAG: hypothetical protein D6E12_13925, partial [Desulfovibrio sp.]